MKTPNSPSQTIEKPRFRILVVEDNSESRRGSIRNLREVGAKYYQLEIDEAATVEEGLRFLEAASETEPYDGVILDLVLPLRRAEHPQKSTTLANYCIHKDPRPCHWVGQLTSWQDDELVRLFWPSPELGIDFRGGVFAKESPDLMKLHEELFFGEIKDPLYSDWLLVELGAEEAPIGRGRGHVPAGFNIYRFIQRLGTVWPDLDEATRERARNLFSIQETGKNPYDPPLRIGFKAFTAWGSQEREGHRHE